MPRPRSNACVDTTSLALFLSPVTISTSVSFDGLLVTGLYTSTPVQSAPIPPPAAFGFGKCSRVTTSCCFRAVLWLSLPRQTSLCWTCLCSLAQTNHQILWRVSYFWHCAVSQWVQTSSVIHIRSQNEYKTTSSLPLRQAMMDEQRGLSQRRFYWFFSSEKNKLKIPKSN